MSCAIHTQPSASTAEPSATPLSFLNEATRRLLEDAPVSVAVVQARAGLPRVHDFDRLELGVLEIEEIEAVIEREHRAAFLAQRHGADVALHRPVLGLAGLGIEAPDRRLAQPPPGAV